MYVDYRGRRYLFVSAREARGKAIADLALFVVSTYVLSCQVQANQYPDQTIFFRYQLNRAFPYHYPPELVK